MEKKQNPSLNSRAIDIGAEIWLEPGHTQSQIYGWFETLQTSGLTQARLLLVWQFLEIGPNIYDFTLYDHAFRAAEQHGIKIIASLQTDSMPAHWGMPYNLHARYLPRTSDEMEIVSSYIEVLVNRYKTSPALIAWLHLDECSVIPSDNLLAIQLFQKWLESKYSTISQLNRLWRTHFRSFQEIHYDKRWWGEGMHMKVWVSSIPHMDFYTFYRSHVAQYLEWVSDCIRKHDPDHALHNYIADMPSNHAARSLDLPTWRSFLDSLGCGIHPPWHFPHFNQSQRGLTTALSCDITRGAIEPKPFWLTETQGGGLLFAGFTHPQHPTKEMLAQIFWTAVGSGAEKVLYWSLNHRLQDYEAGEWGLLDFQNQPSLRLKTLTEFSQVLQDNKHLFSQTQPWKSKVTIILQLETQTLSLKINNAKTIGQSSDAHILEAYGLYQGFQELGVPVEIKFFHDYDWTQNDRNNEWVILPHVLVLTKKQEHDLEQYVSHGNNVIITGLTGFYDEDVRFKPIQDFGLSSLVGGLVKDTELLSDIVDWEFSDSSFTLPVHLWLTELKVLQGRAIAEQDGKVTGIVNSFGQGTVYWLPQLIGLGARISGDFKPLSSLLMRIIPHLSEISPLLFDAHYPGVVQKFLTVPGGYIQVVTNDYLTSQSISWHDLDSFKMQRLWSNFEYDDAQNNTTLVPSGGTFVRALLSR